MKMTGYHRETSAAVPREPRLSDALNDPVVMAVMRADSLSPDELATILRIPVCADHSAARVGQQKSARRGSGPRG
jgi:hypothetical protein